MKITSTQAKALASKIYDEIVNEILVHNQVLYDSEKCLELINKEILKYKPAFDLLEEGIIYSFSINNGTYINSPMIHYMNNDKNYLFRKIISKELGIKSAKFSKEDIERDIIIGTIEHEGIDDLMSSIKAKYLGSI